VLGVVNNGIKKFLEGTGVASVDSSNLLIAVFSVLIFGILLYLLFQFRGDVFSDMTFHCIVLLNKESQSKE
jgi:hypothetical protein